MEAPTQLQLLRRQIQAIPTRHLPTHTRPSLYSTSSSQSFQTKIKFTGLSARLSSPEPIVPVASSKQKEGAEEVVMEETEMNAEEWKELLGYEVYKLCGERKGIAEVMECLEEEAILGNDEDQGRDPTDYNRRAIIFDKSSRVFQALKQRKV